MKARFNCRLYPHPGQAHSLARAFGCARVVWHDALAYCQQTREQGGKTPSGYDLKLSRAISDLGWRQVRTLLEGKGIRYGRTVGVVNRWEPTSQTCSCCGECGGKLDLSIWEWQWLWCGATHDRDINAAKNIHVAGGQSVGGACRRHDSKRTWRNA